MLSAVRYKYDVRGVGRYSRHCNITWTSISISSSSWYACRLYRYHWHVGIAPHIMPSLPVRLAKDNSTSVRLLSSYSRQRKPMQDQVWKPGPPLHCSDLWPQPTRPAESCWPGDFCLASKFVTGIFNAASHRTTGPHVLVVMLVVAFNKSVEKYY